MDRQSQVIIPRLRDEHNVDSFGQWELLIGKNAFKTYYSWPALES